MPRYADYLIERIRYLRIKGNSYGEIQKAVRIRIPKSSLSYICRNVRLPDEYIERIQKLSSAGLSKGRLIAVETNRIKREKFFRDLVQQYAPTAKLTHSVDIAKIALAMLCLGEASKYNPKTHNSFYLGSSNPKIISLFIQLLKRCYN